MPKAWVGLLMAQYIPNRIVMTAAREKWETTFPGYRLNDAVRYASQAVRRPPPLTLGEPEIDGL